MTSFEVRHKLHQRINKSDILEILHWTHQSNQNLQFIYNLVFNENEKVSSNALWILTWDKRTNHCAIRHKLLSIVISTSCVTIIRHSLTLLERMEWTPHYVRADLIDFCFERILAHTQPPGIRAICIKLSFSLCQFHSDLLNELVSILEYLSNYDIPPAVASARKKILNKCRNKNIA